MVDDADVGPLQPLMGKTDVAWPDPRPTGSSPASEPDLRPTGMKPAAELDPRPAGFTLPFDLAATPNAAAVAVPVLFWPKSGGVRWPSISLELKIPEKKEEYIEETVDLARKIHLPRALNFLRARILDPPARGSSTRHTARLWRDESTLDHEPRSSSREATRRGRLLVRRVLFAK